MKLFEYRLRIREIVYITIIKGDGYSPTRKDSFLRRAYEFLQG